MIISNLHLHRNFHHLLLQGHQSLGPWEARLAITRSPHWLWRLLFLMLIVNIHSFRRSCRRHLHLALINYLLRHRPGVGINGQHEREWGWTGFELILRGCWVRRKGSFFHNAFVEEYARCCWDLFKLTTIDDAFCRRGGFLGMGVLSQAGELGSGNFSLGRGHR